MLGSSKGISMGVVCFWRVRALPGSPIPPGPLNMSTGHGHQFFFGQALDCVLNGLRTEACCLRKSVNVSSVLLLQPLESAFLGIGKGRDIHVGGREEGTELCVVLSVSFGIGHTPGSHAGHIHIASEPLHGLFFFVCGIGP